MPAKTPRRKAPRDASAPGDAADPATAPRARPWNIGSIVPWSAVATLGDPVLLLAAPAATLAGIAIVLGLGAAGGAGCAAAPGCPAHLLVPLWSLPPFDAYQDAGAIGLITSSAPLTWLLRAAALLSRAAFFGLMCELALHRARDRAPEPLGAARAALPRIHRFALLELFSFGVFGIPLLLGQGSLLDVGRPVSQLGLLIGQLLIINAFFAVIAGRPAARALMDGLGWLRRRPLGHVALAVAAAASSNGVFWLATAGETGRPRPVVTAVYALVHAVTTTIFLTAYARRWVLLYDPEAEAAARPG